MAGRPGRWGIVAVLLCAGLAGCFATPLPDLGDVRLHQQAQVTLDRWADAVAAAGGPSAFVPAGDLTSQVGDWEEAVGDNNKRTVMAGFVQSAIDLPAEAPPDGRIEWPDGTTQPVRLASARTALAELKRHGEGDCSDCVPVLVTGARLTTAQVVSNRGPLPAPVWEFTLGGTAVRLTRLAIDPATVVQPPPLQSVGAPFSLSIDSATGTVGGLELTVAFTGAPASADQACGEDYTAEAVESTTAVVVIVTTHRNGFPAACALAGAPRTATAKLAAPLGSRTVLEIQQGRPVPAVLTH